MATCQIVPKKSKIPQANNKFYRFIEGVVTRFPFLVVPVQFFAEKVLFPLESRDLPSPEVLKVQGQDVRNFATQVDYSLVPYILEAAENCPDCGLGTLLLVHSKHRVCCYDCFSVRREMCAPATSV